MKNKKPENWVGKWIAFWRNDQQDAGYRGMVIGRVLYVKDDPATSVITGPQLFTDCGPCWEDDVLEWR